MSGNCARKVVTFSVLIAVVAILVPFSVSCSKPPRPAADFTFSYASGEFLIADPIAGTAPLTVRFTDKSTGEITSWRWNLGDGTIVQGAGSDARDFTHTYNTANSSGYVIVLTVRGPGGKDDEEKAGIITVFRCSEAAVVELTQATNAIQACLSAAGSASLDSSAIWDGSHGQVMANGRDAADYLGVWTSFKALYEVAQDGSITSGTDVSWGCIRWDPAGLLGRPGWVANV